MKKAKEAKGRLNRKQKTNLKRRSVNTPSLLPTPTDE